MECVKKLTAEEQNEIHSQLFKEDVEKEDKNPIRQLKLCCYKKCFKSSCWFSVVLEIKNEIFCLIDTPNKPEAQHLYNLCCNVIPHFWDVKPCHSAVFTDKVLTKLVELMRLYGNSWSVAHMCVSLPLPEDTMMILLASDPFKDHFTSTHHPKGYTLLHLVIEQKSIIACKAIMRCSDEYNLDPCFHVRDQESLIPIQRATKSNAKECLTYLLKSQSPHEAQQSSSFLRRGNVLDQFRKAIEDKKSDTVKTLLNTDPSLVHVPYVDGSVCLHKTRDHLTMVHLLDNGADDSTRNQENKTPLHAIIRHDHSVSGSSTSYEYKRTTKEKQNCVVALLAHGKCDINSKTNRGMTPLHLAVEGEDIFTLKALIIFGADLSCVNDYGQTPLDMAKQVAYQAAIDLLQSAIDNNQVISAEQVALNHVCFTKPLDDHTAAYASSIGPICTYTSPKKGDRVLCLDGGGIKGLVLIEMLAAIEHISGKRIVDLFDWIIGTSTGGILALALVYTDLSLGGLRSMYLSLKDKIF
ncbi:85/88 kDa calcium-independent phospholipase A2-like isoform X2 [Dysidea avara]|uniref:85/88 kDa calcium-independent phospholipase A2-like isoform X2 n=1 Tax=Dysidea avara TaxID=196820 RepID=UPI00332B1EC7